MLKIRYWREKREISQSELARMIGRTQSYISQLEANKKIPSLNIIYEIADALLVCPRDLLVCNCRSCRKCKKKAQE